MVKVVPSPFSSRTLYLAPVFRFSSPATCILFLLEQISEILRSASSRFSKPLNVMEPRLVLESKLRVVICSLFCFFGGSENEAVGDCFSAGALISWTLGMNLTLARSRREMPHFFSSGFSV